jgi:hypothetical protein
VSAKPTHNPLYARCTACAGSGEAAPDEGIHDVLPDNLAKVPRKQRAVRICPNCSGRGFTQTPITERFVKELIEEHDAAIEVIQQFSDLVITSALDDDVNYLTDPKLAEINFGCETVLGRARAAGRREPDRPILKKA